ncbi:MULTISPECIES: class I adenylate-forming enzyme family protein [unclassified Variovorax]|uniref:class I adenylate-forming enzyme family protein n=1 Tax=unclassified Variovorax TaxID=663243 RepID=UPI000D129CF2|nr:MULTISPECIES: AMP-binding protein [unclassified Variovorax]AVQ81270.1 AMP-dependent synthetase [Variovorax sp. PMC12]QRY29323.1 AMP-binding protein [Variovorax sp. PDNC026]
MPAATTTAVNGLAPSSAPRLHARISRVTLGDVVHRSARRFGERTALIEGEHRLSYRALDAASNRFAHHLLDLGLAKGARVGMLCNNSTQMVIAMLGIQKAGLVWVPINTALAVDAIGYILAHAEVRHVVIDNALHAKPELRELLQATGVSPLLCVLDSDTPPPGIPTVQQAVAQGPETLPDVDIDSTDLALIMYTSGTTGRQKGVMHSHASVHSVLLSNMVEWGSSPERADVWSSVLPLFHCGQHTVLMSALSVGGAVVVLRGFDPGAMLAAIERHRITVAVGLPMMYGALLAHPQRASRDLSSLRLCVYAMAPMSRTLLLRLLDEFCPSFALVSGQTEMYPGATIFEASEQRKRFGSYWGVGTLVNEVAVMGDGGELLAPGQVGEIVFRGPNVMLGYYKDPEATANAQRFGWHHSGDLGRMDDDGQLIFLDRLKDMVKSGGENVPSIKVEEVLLRHPGVMNAAVVGLPHEHWGEAITAFVTRRPDAPADFDEAALTAHCKEHLGGFEVPKQIIFLAALPMTSTGKIQKFELRKAHQDNYTRG